jgi:hypothetical protein
MLKERIMYIDFSLYELNSAAKDDFINQAEALLTSRSISIEIKSTKSGNEGITVYDDHGRHFEYPIGKGVPTPSDFVDWLEKLAIVPRALPTPSPVSPDEERVLLKRLTELGYL